MEIKELIRLQQEFDSRHKGNFPWDEAITAHNPQMLEYLALALCGEAGEVANVIKKVIRGDVSYEEQREHVIEEVTDVLIYILKFAYQMNFDLESAYLDKMKKNKDRFKQYENK